MRPAGKCGVRTRPAAWAWRSRLRPGVALSWPRPAYYRLPLDDRLVVKPPHREGRPDHDQVDGLGAPAATGAPRAPEWTHCAAAGGHDGALRMSAQMQPSGYSADGRWRRARAGAASGAPRPPRTSTTAVTLAPGERAREDPDDRCWPSRSSRRLVCVCAPFASAATPPAGTLTPDACGRRLGRLERLGEHRRRDAHLRPGGEVLRRRRPARSRPRAATSSRSTSRCPANFYSDHPGAVNITATGFGLADLDLFVYKRNPDGTRGDYVTGDGQTLGADESVGIDKAAGAYCVLLTPYTTVGAQGYSASAVLVTRQGVSQADVEQNAPPGVTNYRASRDAVHVALRADDRDGSAEPRPPHRRLEDVREQREVPLQGRHVRVVRRRAHVGGPGPPARLLRGARPVRPRQRGRLPHDLGPDDRLRRRGQRVRQRARRARRHERVQGLQHDRPHQAPAAAVDGPDDRARQPRQRADDGAVPRRQELDRGRQPHRRQRRRRTGPTTARSARCTSAGASTAPARCRCSRSSSCARSTAAGRGAA